MSHRDVVKPSLPQPMIRTLPDRLDLVSPCHGVHAHLNNTIHAFAWRRTTLIYCSDDTNQVYA